MNKITNSMTNIQCHTIRTKNQKKKWQVTKALFGLEVTHHSNLLTQTSKSIHISSSKFSVYFTRKNLLFLFYTITYIKHPHQFFYFTRYFNKIFILLHFFIISLNYPCLRTHALSLSLSLSLLIFLELNTSLSFSVSLFSPFSHSFSKTSNPDHFFKESHAFIGVSN